MKIKDLEIMKPLKINLGLDTQITLISKNTVFEIIEEVEDSPPEKQPAELQQVLLQK